MTGSVVITLIAVVLSAGDGSLTVGGEALDLLRPGDRGEIFYELTVGSENRRIDIGSAEVLSAEREQAVLRPAVEAGRVQAGYSVELTVPYERLGAAAEAGPARPAEISSDAPDEPAPVCPSAAEVGAELRARLRELEQRSAALETEVEALVFVLGKTIAESRE